MASKVSTTPPLTTKRNGRVFPTLESFNEGYAGPDTKLLEKKSRDLAGRQDDFCIICGTHAEELFPQVGPGEIHLCPRQLCKRCWHIEAGWKRDSPTKRRSLVLDVEGVSVRICCPLCWKRGWDFCSPLLGIHQPEWETDARFSQHKDDVLPLRYKNWERAATTKVFSWRKPLLADKDDMTIESDRELLRGMLKRFQKNPKRFKLFNQADVVEAASDEHVFDVGHAFHEHCNTCMNTVSPFNSDEEIAEEVVPNTKRGPGRPKKKSRPPGWFYREEPVQPDGGTPIATSTVESPEILSTGGRPKRHTARLSFAGGVPQYTTASVSDDQDDSTPAPRSLRTRVRKIVILPVSLPTSPMINKDAAEDGAPEPKASLASNSFQKTQPIPETVTEDDRIDGSLTEASPQAARGLQPNGLETTSPSRLDHNHKDAYEPLAHGSNAQDSIVGQNAGTSAMHEQLEQTNAQLCELRRSYEKLQADHGLLGTRYRRWRSGVVENAKLLFEQEEDLIAKKGIINELNKTIKQLSSDNAHLGAELALARGMVQYNPALLKQTLLRSSLTPDVVERLFSNPDFIQLLQPRPANGEVDFPQPLQTPGSARPKKRRRITTAETIDDAAAEEARQKKLSRVIAPTLKRLEKSRFNLSAAKVEEAFDADTAESKRFLDSLIEFAKLPISFEEALVLIQEAQQDRKQGRVVVPQLRLLDPTWAPWDVKTAQKRFVDGHSESMVEKKKNNDVGSAKKKPKSMAEMVADAKAVREAAARGQVELELDGMMVSADDTDDASPVPSTDETRHHSVTRGTARAPSENRRVWERHEELRRQREQSKQLEQEQEEQQRAAKSPPLDMTDPLQALAASMFTSVNGSGSGGSKGKAKAQAPAAMNGRRRLGSPKRYQRREPSEDVDFEEEEEEEMEADEEMEEEMEKGEPIQLSRSSWYPTSAGND